LVHKREVDTKLYDIAGIEKDPKEISKEEKRKEVKSALICSTISNYNSAWLNPYGNELYRWHDYRFRL